MQNKKTIIIVIAVVIFSGILVGAGLKLKSRDVNASQNNTSDGEVAGDLTVATPIQTPTNIPSPTDSPTDTPYPYATDQNAEGADIATATPAPTASPTPTTTPTPTPSPDIYLASITTISNSPASATNGSVIITVNITKNGSPDCGETVNLISDPTGVSFSAPSTCDSGNTTFMATSSIAGTYHVTTQIYGVNYGNSSDVIFN